MYFLRRQQMSTIRQMGKEMRETGQQNMDIIESNNSVFAHQTNCSFVF